MLAGLISVVIIVIIDQLAKHYARNNFKGKKIKKGFLTFSLVKNPGAFKGFLKKRPKLLLIIQSVSSIGMLGLALFSGFKKKDSLLTIGLTLIAGGAIGNLLDRILDGEVTDFLAIKWTKNLYYNVADIVLFTGALLTALRSHKY